MCEGFFMPNTTNQSPGGRWKNIRCFAAVVRSPAAVRNAFDGHIAFAAWWKLVLRLHGKPAQLDFSPRDRCLCIAEGFRFYGWLYRALAVLLVGAAFVCGFSQSTDGFWIGLLTASGIYLWLVASLAFSGATTFCDSKGRQVWHLVAFLFFIALFLGAALTMISLQVRIAGWLSDVANSFATLGMMVFGIGSYIIELAALVADQPWRNERSS